MTDAVAPGWRHLPAVASALAFAGFVSLVPAVVAGGAPTLALPWVPALGVEAAFRLDGLGLAFALLVTGIGALILLYAASYFRTDRRLGSLLLTLSAFEIAMLGVVTADDLVTLFVFWEATTITSWLLVGFDHERGAARAAALQALVITAAGGLALLAGLLLMGMTAGSWRLSGLGALQTSTAYPLILGLVVVAAFAKSAQWPFHFWLPNAMAAPTPVSAYLHSATMVKAGVYLLARLAPNLGDTALWHGLLIPAGAITMLIGAVWALRQTDLKLMLAWTTLMGLGLMTLLLGVGTPAAITAAVGFLLVHALYKAGLFLAVGMIEKGAGSRNYTDLGALARAMPVTTVVVTLAAAAMAGLPPFLGFVAKELIYAATLGNLLLTLAVVVANALMVACAGMIALRPFAGPPRSPNPTPGDPVWGLRLGPVVLAVLGLGFGLLPMLAENWLIGPMHHSVAAAPLEGHLGLWHGLGLPLGLSVATWALGLGIYLNLNRLRDGLAAAEPRLPRTEAWYDALMAGLFGVARAITAATQTGRATSYLRVTFAVLAVMVWGALLTGPIAWPSLAQLRAATFIDWAITAIVLASIAIVLRSRSRLTAIAALGGVGSGIAFIFILYGATDVAMTQLFVEILVVVFLGLAMVRLPTAGDLPFRRLNALVAAALGIGATVAVLAVLGTPLDPVLSTFFEANSYPEAHGRNIVNVILVDFRGFDTLGEISVVVIAAVAAIAVLKRRVR
ncbi:multicomponent Na+:H+ antiporter subunit A [Amaricoccus macauensis]|uniref:Multicomponent Na+:H+ antiporter subunit A n=1 Tax=Amaricoccus macauensis TaxID=57001 RepID=A0A840SJ57_9RHOB|nr:hydrogen gas-evolving membrane-bound hydrogenase subunit E [Amaricoccus macauensis]MBB5220984.1 multicomponent Na+:H+ antiporter subunit A [Amaricoccus macauensis]